ncbi:hypothetical protein EDB85DRAFT_2213513 [Lactarius pseudohatsudake]|nr:hypothetical protein EDB85DRAFT_2213513 [Lactarius pseudohatsudake]
MDIPHNSNTMSIVRPGSSEPNEVVSDVTLHDKTLQFEFPGSDIVLRSCNSHDFRVPKLYIDICSPVLRIRIRNISSTSDGPLPVVKLSESKVTIYSLLTFIFPVVPILPSTTEKTMELLAVAQKYQMESVLTRVRGAISRQDPPFIRPEIALHVYFLAQKYKLHQEALQAARVTLRLSMTIEGLGDKLNFPGMTGAYLHELWKYHQRVRTRLKTGLLEFKNSGLPDVVKALRCNVPYSYSDSFPQWLYDYIGSIAGAPQLFDLIEFESAWAHHIQDNSYSSSKCSCVGISNQVIRTFWGALTAVVHRAIDEADSTLALMKEEPASGNSDPPSVPLCLDMPDASIIVRSSDQANFRVHKSVLAMSSSFFKHPLSFPRPPDDELVDGLPVIQLSEDTGLLNSLISLLYPISPVIPSSYEKVFALLAACKKYGMTSTLSYIRSEIEFGTFPTPVADEAFRAYAIAGSMGLIPEMESAARLTQTRPMTFESLGEGLRSFKGRALCDLLRFRRAPARAATASVASGESESRRSKGKRKKGKK